MPGERYELGPRVGAGGSGEVYRAFDARLRRSVAVKIFRPGALVSADRRLADEARLLAKPLPFCRRCLPRFMA